MAEQRLARWRSVVIFAAGLGALGAIAFSFIAFQAVLSTSSTTHGAVGWWAWALIAAIAPIVFARLRGLLTQPHAWPKALGCALLGYATFTVFYFIWMVLLLTMAVYH